MSSRALLSLFVFGISLFGVASAKTLSDKKTTPREIALSFDDCPRKTGTLLAGMDRAHKIVDALKASKVQQVAFFCNSPSREPDGVERIKYFADQGHIIANHSANHWSADTTPLADFLGDIKEAHSELKNFSNFRQWFRFPFLHEGKKIKKIEAIRKYLKKSGYTNGYVTVDTQEWYMDDAFTRAAAQGKKINYEKLCTTYRDMMTDEAEFFDNMSVQALGRSVKHVMLLHETDLNAYCLSTVIDGLRNKGWSIISPDEAYQDPIAAQEPSSSVALYQGRVFALAKEKGYKGPYYSPWIEEANIDKEFLKKGAW